MAEKKTFIGKVANELAAVSNKFAKAKQQKAAAKVTAAQAKAIKMKMKNDQIIAKQGLAKTRARWRNAALMAASISSNASKNNASAAMSEWVKAINSNSPAVEGTGEASPGTNSEASNNGTVTTGTPLGNYRYR